MIRPPPRSPLFPYTTLSRSHAVPAPHGSGGQSTPGGGEEGGGREEVATQPALPRRWARTSLRCSLDRKSTRLNSSHSQISYAVFCLKKKTTNFCSHTARVSD